MGFFPAYGRWAEWNGKFRDGLRRFLKGEPGLTGDIAQRIQGSPDLYASRGPTASINFITCHDGFTLYDLVSYNDKHNEANGEGNRDGANDNNSWNCGCEGSTTDVDINALRMRQMKNAAAMLLVSQGVPMILMGDEIARTQNGNNNTYCQDNSLNWLDWNLMNTQGELLRFYQKSIKFRLAHPVFRNRWHLSNQDRVGSGFADISWHGTKVWQPDWSGSSRLLAFMLDGKHARGGMVSDDDIYVAMNMHWESHWFELPRLPGDKRWHVFANTGVPSPADVWENGQEPVLANQDGILLGDRSVVILVGK